ncbi:MAG: uroporphyrinogen-III C-methyltransferase [Candidatus Promineifilaceae bacterium]
MSQVYLVGAGPGDPELIAVRGYRLLQSADVILHDRLVSPLLIAEARPDAKIINVGKSPLKKRYPQAEINRILVEEAQQGKTVVRIKGGDPFIFGLGGDECLALIEAGIPFEIVPGVSSVMAVPAYAGIPVTHRGLASSLTVLSGHSLDGEAWRQLPKMGTIVVVMGVKKLTRIVEIVRRFRSAETPVALIQSGTTPNQVVIQGTLTTIVAQSTEIKPPAIIVIGEVVALRDVIRWFEPSGLDDNSAETVWGIAQQ